MKDRSSGVLQRYDGSVNSGKQRRGILRATEGEEAFCPTGTAALGCNLEAGPPWKEEAIPEHVCPWWLGYFLINPLRRWRQDPRKILEPYICEGMTVLEPGPGMGFFTLELARLVGASGRVLAVEIQPRMLAKLERRAAQRGLGQRIEPHLASKDSMGLHDRRATVDFVFAFAVVHEMPSAATFFREAAEALKPGGLLLIAEPKGHVKTSQFDAELKSAAEAGLAPVRQLSIPGNHAALLRK